MTITTSLTRAEHLAGQYSILVYFGHWDLFSLYERYGVAQAIEAFLDVVSSLSF